MQIHRHTYQRHTHTETVKHFTKHSQVCHMHLNTGTNHRKKMKISMDSPHTGWPPQHMIRCTWPPANSALARSGCRSVFHSSMGRGNGASSTLGLSVSVYYLESCFFPNSPNFSLNRVHMTFILEKLAFHPRRNLSIPKTTISLLLSCQLYTHLFSTICSTFTTIYSMYLLHARQTLGHGQAGHSQMK